MTIAYVSRGGITSSNGTTSLTPGSPSVVTVGNLLIAWAIVNGSRTITLSGSGWNLIEQFTDGTISFAIAWEIADGSVNSPSFSWPAPTVLASSVCTQWSGSDASAPIGSTAHNSGSSTSMTCSAITSTRDASMVVAILHDLTGSNIPPTPTGYSSPTSLSQTNPPNSFRLADETLATSGTASGAVSITINSANWAAYLLEIKVPSGGGLIRSRGMFGGFRQLHGGLQ